MMSCIGGWANWMIGNPSVPLAIKMKGTSPVKTRRVVSVYTPMKIVNFLLAVHLRTSPYGYPIRTT